MLDPLTPLERGIQKLRTDHDNGARILATFAIETLHEILLDETSHDKPDAAAWPATITVPLLWRTLYEAARQLRNARPSMSTPIVNALIATLAAIKAAWDEHAIVYREAGFDSAGAAGTQASLREAVRIASEAMDAAVGVRSRNTVNLARCFRSWLVAKKNEPLAAFEIRAAMWREMTNTDEVSQRVNTIAATSALLQQSPSTRLSSIDRDSLEKKIADERREAERYVVRKGPLRILTLSYSSSLLECLRSAIVKCPEIQLDITVLESRPKFEGAAFAVELAKAYQASNPAGKSLAEKESVPRVRITVAPDSHIALVAQNADVVLLGADRISPKGEVSNKMGSLAAVICATANRKKWSPLSPDRTPDGVEVVVVAESEKLVPGPPEAWEMSSHKADTLFTEDSEMQYHAESEYQATAEENEPDEVTSAWGLGKQDMEIVNKGVTVRNVYFEWLGSNVVNTFIFETGVMRHEELVEASQDMGKIGWNVYRSVFAHEE